jgi:diguanylate cyclase (GGDEF)-like protein
MATSVSREPEALPSDWVRHFVDEIPSGIAVFDDALRYVAANPRWINAFHLTATAFAGRRHDELDPLGGAGMAELLGRALSGDTVEGCTTLEDDGAGQPRQRVVGIRPRVAHDGAVIGVVAALHEVATGQGGQRAEHASDQLTGIAGRSSFLARLRSALEGDAEAHRGTATFLLDIENFKGVNDLYGARIGDAVLKTVATRLVTSTRSRALFAARSEARPTQAHADLIARLGADEFAIILDAAANAADAEAFAKRLLQVVSAPILAGDQRIRLTANIGYLVTNPAHRTEDDVLRDLDVALQEAKMRGPSSLSDLMVQSV